MQRAGATIVDVQMPAYGRWGDDEMEVLLYEFKDGINRYLAGSNSARKSLADLIAWNRANADRAMPLFGQELFELAQKKGPLTDAAYVKARDTAKRLAGAEGLLAVLTQQNLTAVVAPSTGPAWPVDYKAGDRRASIGGYGVAAVAGTPSITIPIGHSRGLPFGLTFMGPPFSESQLLSLAYALEQRTKARLPPRFLPTLEP
jgi:amidase